MVLPQLQSTEYYYLPQRSTPQPRPSFGTRYGVVVTECSTRQSRRPPRHWSLTHLSPLQLVITDHIVCSSSPAASLHSPLFTLLAPPFVILGQSAQLRRQNHHHTPPVCSVPIISALLRTTRLSRVKFPTSSITSAPSDWDHASYR